MKNSKNRISSRRITVLHDNCGEVVLDKLLLRCIKEMRPDKGAYIRGARRPRA